MVHSNHHSKTGLAAIFAVTILLATFATVSCNSALTTNTTADTTTSNTTAGDTSHTAANNNTTGNDSTPVNTDWLLIPGVAAGQTTINENADSVYLRLGTPDGGDAAMMKAVSIWYAHHDTIAYSTAIYSAKNTDSPVVARVLQIRVTSPIFKTAEGIHTTSSLQEIQRRFAVQQAEQYSDAGTNYTVYDSRQGIAFEIAPNATCVAIIIHEPGANKLGTYLKFRTTNKYFR